MSNEKSPEGPTINQLEFADKRRWIGLALFGASSILISEISMRLFMNLNLIGTIEIPIILFHFLATFISIVGCFYGYKSGHQEWINFYGYNAIIFWLAHMIKILIDVYDGTTNSDEMGQWKLLTIHSFVAITQLSSTILLSQSNESL
ncbi:unnamed protein product, partial [Mesorhabditis belari]|uniref:Uncharacterized protein n=1 Tax=Mesorhabditis belari TaxID=2138241 RepID=A0AAF3EK35_9BILA